MQKRAKAELAEIMRLSPNAEIVDKPKIKIKLPKEDKPIDNASKQKVGRNVFYRNNKYVFGASPNGSVPGPESEK